MNLTKNEMIEEIKQRGNFTIDLGGTYLYGSERCASGIGFKVEDGIATFNTDGREDSAKLEELSLHSIEFIYQWTWNLK
jgi:hypothetical protein